MSDQSGASRAAVTVNWAKWNRMHRWLRFKQHYSPRHWEFGFGVYFGHWYKNFFTAHIMRKPTCIDLFFGPWTLEISFGYETEVIE